MAWYQILEESLQYQRTHENKCEDNWNFVIDEKTNFSYF